MKSYVCAMSRNMNSQGVHAVGLSPFGQIIQVFENDPGHVFTENELNQYMVRDVELTDEQLAAMNPSMGMTVKVYKVTLTYWSQSVYDTLWQYGLVEIEGVNYSDGRNGAAPVIENAEIDEVT